MSIKSSGLFKYQNGKIENWYYDCFCGSKKEYFSSDYGDKYCCVHQDSPQLNDCLIDDLTDGMWCPNATLLSKNHICDSNCFYNSMEICPSNPEACMNDYYGCDGRQSCEAYCAGPLENFPYYDQTDQTCVNEYAFCGNRSEAKYQHHQCFGRYGQLAAAATVIGYQCLNRKDITENTIRSSANYNSFVSTRKNLFQYFKANDTRNQVTGHLIICGDQNITMDCEDWDLDSRIECKKEEADNGGILVSNKDICDALDLLEDKGLPPPDEYWMDGIYDSPQQLGM